MHSFQQGPGSPTGIQTIKHWALEPMKAETSTGPESPLLLSVGKVAPTAAHGRPKLQNLLIAIAHRSQVASIVYCHNSRRLLSLQTPVPLLTSLAEAGLSVLSASTSLVLAYLQVWWPCHKTDCKDPCKRVHWYAGASPRTMVPGGGTRGVMLPIKMSTTWPQSGYKCMGRVLLGDASNPTSSLLG